MKRLVFVALLGLACVVRIGAQWAENKRREELTDSQILDLHEAEAADRAADDHLVEVRRQIRQAHGEDDRHTVDLYEGYVVITELQGESR